MSDVVIRKGGPPMVPAVSADQVTIAGSGTTFDPLHVVGSSAGPVVHDDSLAGAGTAGAPLSVVNATIPLINADVVALEPGMPVAPSTLESSSALCGNAADQSRSVIIGLVFAGAAPTLTARVVAIGVLELTIAQWNARTGGSGGLIPGATYYLGPGFGTMTTTPPSESGYSVNELGHAIDHTKFVVSPKIPTLL